jgi:hypothetical protein
MPNVKRITVDYGAKSQVVYAIIRREVDKYLLNDGTGAFASAPGDPYLSLTEDGTIRGRYEVDESRAAWDDGEYQLVAYNQVGGSPSPLADTMIGTGKMSIASDTETTLASIQTKAIAIDAKTTNLPASPAAVGSLMDLVNAPNATAIAAIQGTMGTAVTGIKTQTDKLLFDASNRVKSVQQFPVAAVVSSVVNVPTSFLTNLTEAVEGYWVGAWWKFTSGTLINQVRKITGYNGSTKVVSVASAFTGTPAGADTACLINE